MNVLAGSCRKIGMKPPHAVNHHKSTLWFPCIATRCTLAAVKHAIKRALQMVLPNGAINHLRATRSAIKTAASAYGVYSRTCPICSYHGRFLADGFPTRLDCMCPSCGSVERHRLLKLWLDAHGNLITDKSVLHFAPERSISKIIRPLAAKYLTADISNEAADILLDLHSLSLPDRSYEVVICSHVLEHVDDKRALSELFRVIRPGGFAILMFPVIEGWDRTYENPEVSTSEERLLHFGRADHVRYFGRDVRDRIRSAGFEIDEYTAEEPLVHQYGLMRGEKIFIATRPVA